MYTLWETLCHVEKLNLFNYVTHLTYDTHARKPLLLEKNFRSFVILARSGKNNVPVRITNG